jgi:hypothetical protein
MRVNGMKMRERITIMADITVHKMGTLLAENCNGGLPATDDENQVSSIVKGGASFLNEKRHAFFSFRILRLFRCGVDSVERISARNSQCVLGYYENALARGKG